jgi:hypothetical protein
MRRSPSTSGDPETGTGEGVLLTACGLLLVVAAALAVSWPLLSGDTSPLGQEPEADSSGIAERRRDATLAALKETEFDYQVGKLSEEDYAAALVDLEARALVAIAEVDAARPWAAGAASDSRPETPGVVAVPTTGEAARPTPVTPPRGGGPRGGRSFCAACGRANPVAARHCAACGRAIAPRAERSRKRA